MSDETTSTTSEPLLTGKAAEEAKEGYTPLVDETKAAEAEELTKKEAADRLAALSSSKPVTTHVSTGLDREVTMTIEQGAKLVADARAAEAAQAELDGTKALQNEVD